MENPSEVPPETQVDGPDSPTSRGFPDHGLRTELESLRQSYRSLLSRFAALEESLNLHQQERDEAVTRNADLVKVIGEITSERNSLSGRIRELEASMREQEDRCAVRIEEEGNERERLKKDAETYRERIENLETAREKSNGFLLKCVDSLRLTKESLFRIINNVDEEEIENGGKENDGVGVELELELEEELRAVSDEIMEVTRLAGMAELKVNEYKELGKKEKRELENSVVSLTEENRDINSLLRIALVEKEAVEKSLNRLKGNNDQKRVPLLQIAERGLQRVGFGFMMGSGSGEHSSESSGTKLDTSGTKSDSSECEEEVVSLASTVERIMKNLRLEITQLRRSLEESRSDTERLQSLAEKQAQDIAENMLYIKELENRERILAQNVDELLMEVKETETEVARWREACELEVEAGKHEIEERDKVVTILTQELEKTKTALDMSNRKLNVKEELAAAAMVAQAAAEKSLQLADRRAAGLRERVEELSRQLEEAESQERSRRKVRHLCWPWRVLKLNTADSANDRLQNVRRMLPEMQAFLH